jgi:hypothetical protein
VQLDLDRSFCEIKLPGNGLVGKTIGHEHGDFALTWCKLPHQCTIRNKTIPRMLRSRLLRFSF